MNEQIARLWVAKSRKDKHQIRQWALSGKDAFETLLEMLRGARPAAYDMVSDPLGEVVWSRLAATLAEEVPFTAGEAPPDTAGVDWANVIEEIEGVGRFARYAVLTELRAALRLVLMAYRWPAYQEAGRWLAAADGALIEARTACDPGMEGRLDLEGAYRDARGLVEPMRTQGHAPRPLPAAVPLGFGDLLGRPLLAHGLLRRVEEAAAAEAEAAAPGKGAGAGPR